MHARTERGVDSATQLTTDLREISHDGHLGAKYHAEDARTEPENWSIEDLNAMREEAEGYSFSFRKVERMDGNVGETTGGGAHPTRQFQVTEHFSMWIPFARSLSPSTHKDWEGIGVSPDIAVPAADALSTAYRAALQRIVVSTKDPELKHSIKQLLAAPPANK